MFVEAEFFTAAGMQFIAAAASSLSSSSCAAAKSWAKTAGREKWRDALGNVELMSFDDESIEPEFNH